MFASRDQAYKLPGRVQVFCDLFLDCRPTVSTLFAVQGRANGVSSSGKLSFILGVEYGSKAKSVHDERLGQGIKGWALGAEGG